MKKSHLDPDPGQSDRAWRFALSALSAASPVLAAPNPQLTNFPTPTPGTDGRIIYIVQEGDTLWRIAAVAGINVADLRDLNNLDADDIVFTNAAALFGIGRTICPAVHFCPCQHGGPS